MTRCELGHLVHKVSTNDAKGMNGRRNPAARPPGSCCSHLPHRTLSPHGARLVPDVFLDRAKGGADGRRGCSCSGNTGKRGGCDGSGRCTTRTFRFCKNRSLCSDFNAYCVLSFSRQIPLARERRKADEDSKMTMVPFRTMSRQVKASATPFLPMSSINYRGLARPRNRGVPPKYHKVSLCETQLITLVRQ